MYQSSYGAQGYYPQQIQQLQQPQQTMALIKGRPVSSIEEARAIPIDFDGSVFYFPDIANRRIYTKQINLDGTSTLNMYELTEIPKVVPVMTENGNYVTREEFEQALTQLKNSLLAAAPPSEARSVVGENSNAPSSPPPTLINF